MTGGAAYMQNFSDRRAAKLALSLALVCGSLSPASSQVLPAAPANSTAGGGNLAEFVSSGQYQLLLTCVIGLFGLVTIGSLTYSITKMGTSHPDDLSKPFIIVTVVFASLMLITAGYSTEQIAPAFGLFGTIIGYMFGRLMPSGSPASTTPRPDAQTADEQTQAASNGAGRTVTDNPPGRRAVTP